MFPSRNVAILYRPGHYDMDDSELGSAKVFFDCFHQRTAIRAGDLIIPRYSYLPFPESLQADCDYVSAELINPIKQHRYAADIRLWGEDMGELTPKTWYRIEDIDQDGPYVLKGKTNSRKFDWKTHMFAKDRAAASEVAWRLQTDGLIGGGSQDVYIRKYVPLKTFMVGINDLPVTNEFRFFVAYGEVLCGAYYWANYSADLPSIPQASEVPRDFLNLAIKRVGANISFYAIDVAQTAEGGWIVIEVNDGCMSGLSENNADMLYGRLRDTINQKLLATPETP